MDPWVVTPQEWTRFCTHFQALKPVGGVITGEQAKGFLLQSRLPPPVLGAIWGLADTDADGRMNIIEFTIACKLISLKLRGLELPKVIPSNLWNSVQSLNSVPKASSPLLTSPPTMTPGIAPPMTLPLSNVSPTTILPAVTPPLIPAASSPIGTINPTISPVVNRSSPVQIANLTNNMALVGQAGPIKPALPAAPSLPGTPVASMPMPISIDSPGNQEWAVPHQTKLKYTQIFNTTDRTRTGFLTGVQARGIMVATQLPQNVLAQIWNLSDMDKDGQLCCDEFVLAMYLCDLAKSGEKIRIPLPPELIPPSVRRQRQNSLTAPSEGTPESDTCLINQTTFEDKRKENFEKGQAELERRRKALLEIQRKEQEERERKEREEQDRREKIRLEQEKRRQDELEIQMRKQKELEQEREEQRKRAQEQREAARKEMERQRQLEWEKQRSMELQQQRQKEQETVLKLKGKNQSLTIDLQQMTDKVRELSQKISETRASVTGVKSTIDSMRTTRDTQMNEMSRLKSTLKEQNQRLITVSQEKVRLEAKNKMNHSIETAEIQEQTQSAVSNKKLTFKSLQDKIDDLNSQIELKKQDVENNNSSIDQLKTQLTKLVEDCEKIYPSYEENTKKVMEMKKSKAKEMSSWGDDAWNSAPTTDWVEEKSATTLESSAYKKCRALYEFEARNTDELSFQPGDIIMVPLEQNAEPGWLTGELKNKTGWFPESYVETVDGSDDIREIIANRQAPLEDNFVSTQKPLEGIAELPENELGQGFETDEFSTSCPKLILGHGKSVNIKAQVLDNWAGKDNTCLSLVAGDIIDVSENQDDWWYGKTSDNRVGWFPKSSVSVIEDAVKDTNIPSDKQEYYIVLYPYESVEPGDLNMNQDEVVLVTKKDGDWWTGIIGDRSGIFPSNYVQYLDPQPKETTVNKNPPFETASSVKSETSVTSSPLTTPIMLEPQKPNGSRSVTPDLASTKRESSATEDSENDDKITKGTKKAEVATVIAPYTATSTEQLSLQRGQLVKIRKKTTTGWWEGELQAKGQKRQIGWFPASYVKPLGNTGRANSPATKSNQSAVMPVTTPTPSSNNSLEKVIALFPFNAVHNDELTFQKDEIITLVSKDEQAWWRGELNGKTGLFPSNYVAPLSEVTIKVKLNKEERKRQQHIHELITTEQAYIEDMTAVHEVFEKPLYESGVLTTSDICKIFINWEEIIECNQIFLTSLRVRRDMSSAGIVRIVGDILCEHFPRMTRYVRFCSCQLNAAITLQKLTETNPAFCEVTKRCQSDSRIKGLPLSSFLIKPMQRITKYPLLVQKILEHTPNSHPDRLHLEEALAKAEEICLQVNEGVREKENSDRLEWLQTHVNSEGLSERLIFNSLTNSLGSRKFLHYGSLSKTKSGKELVGFLMNDMFLLVEPVKPSILSGQTFSFDKFLGDSFKIYKQPFLLMLLNIADSVTDSVEFRIDYDNIPILLSSPSINERNLWLKKLNEAKKILIASEKNQKQLMESKKADFGACGRVLVFVMDGRKLQTPKLGKKAAFCEVSMGSRKQCTQVSESPDPKWDSSMQFLVKDIQDDILCVTVFNKGHYSPDEFLGRSEIRVSEIIQSTKNSRGPLTKHLQLREVQTGVITLKLDLCLFDSN